MGKYLVINPETGDYIMGTDPDMEDDLEVSRRAIARFSTSRLFGLRIGYPAAAAFGGGLRPYEHPLGDADDNE